jgi:hypothetical protein
VSCSGSNDSDLCSAGGQLECILTVVNVFLLRPAKQMKGEYLKLDHGRFFQSLFNSLLTIIQSFQRIQPELLLTSLRKLQIERIKCVRHRNRRITLKETSGKPTEYFSFTYRHQRRLTFIHPSSELAHVTNTNSSKRTRRRGRSYKLDRV